VVEPFQGAPVINKVERVALAGSDPEQIGLRVSFKDGRVDTWLVNLNSTEVTGRAATDQVTATADGAMALRGRVGFVSTKAAAPRRWCPSPPTSCATTAARSRAAPGTKAR
jgi:hypothetical protein